MFKLELNNLPVTLEKLFTNNLKNIKLRVPFNCEVIFTGHPSTCFDYDYFKTIENNNDLNMRKMYEDEYSKFRGEVIPIN